MSIGISLLVHSYLHRAEQLARALLKAGCKVAIHVDAKVDDDTFIRFQKSLAGLENLNFVPRIACEWGAFSLVQAQLQTAAYILKTHPDVKHIVQLSGSCLPTRPIAEFQTYLEKYPDTDFIESTKAGGQNWIKGGLEAERFTLYFPFSWTKQRRRFDALVNLQRKFKVKRKIPDGLTPHIGSQWWALTRHTLDRILNDPERENYDRFFAKCWIPDESYFQTITRKHSKKIISRSLTFNRFDFQGKPMVFYDDHLHLLGHLNGFFVRKVWSGANKLYNTLLSSDYAPGPRSLDKRAAFQAMITQSESRRTAGRNGLIMQSCAPKPSKITTAAPYFMFEGFDRVFDQFGDWFDQQTDIPLHGHLFEKKRINFAQNRKLLPGNIPNNPKVRDYNPVKFLVGLIWNMRQETLAFRFRSSQNRQIANLSANDPNAHIFHVQSAWVLDIMRENITDPARLKKRVERAVKNEHRRCEELNNGVAQTVVIPLARVLSNPAEVLEQIVRSVRPDLASPGIKAPDLRPIKGLDAYLQMLANEGMNLNIDLNIYSNSESIPDGG